MINGVCPDSTIVVLTQTHNITSDNFPKALSEKLMGELSAELYLVCILAHVFYSCLPSHFHTILRQFQSLYSMVDSCQSKFADNDENYVIDKFVVMGKLSYLRNGVLMRQYLYQLAANSVLSNNHSFIPLLLCCLVSGRYCLMCNVHETFIWPGTVCYHISKDGISMGDSGPFPSVFIH